MTLGAAAMCALAMIGAVGCSEAKAEPLEVEYYYLPG